MVWKGNTEIRSIIQLLPYYVSVSSRVWSTVREIVNFIDIFHWTRRIVLKAKNRGVLIKNNNKKKTWLWIDLCRIVFQHWKRKLATNKHVSIACVSFQFLSHQFDWEKNIICKHWQTNLLGSFILGSVFQKSSITLNGTSLVKDTE